MLVRMPETEARYLLLMIEMSKALSYWNENIFELGEDRNANDLGGGGGVSCLLI